MMTRLFLVLTLLFILPAGLLSQDEDTTRFSEAEKERLRQELADWESRQNALFQQLTKAIKSKDQKETYFILKELRGGGAGEDGSEYELRLLKIEQKKKRLAAKKKKRADLEELISAFQDWNQEEMDSKIKNGMNKLESDIKKIERDIAVLQNEANQIVDKTIKRELPMLLELLLPKSDKDEQ